MLYIKYGKCFVKREELRGKQEALTQHVGKSNTDDVKYFYRIWDFIFWCWVKLYEFFHKPKLPPRFNVPDEPPNNRSAAGERDRRTEMFTSKNNSKERQNLFCRQMWILSLVTLPVQMYVCVVSLCVCVCARYSIPVATVTKTPTSLRHCFRQPSHTKKKGALFPPIHPSIRSSTCPAIV